MSRRVVILQRGSDRVSAVAAVLAERGHPVAVTRSTREATALIRDHCGAVLIDGPEPDCGGPLCWYVRHEVRPMPAMVGVLSSVSVPDSGGAAAADALDEYGLVLDQGALPGREATPHPCHGCMVLLSSDTSVEEITAAVEAAVRWWPGDD